MLFPAPADSERLVGKFYLVAKARIKSREQAKKGNKVERADVPF